MSASPIADRLEHEGWCVLVYVAWDDLDRRFIGRAELLLEASLRCRIALDRDFETDDEAACSLRGRAKQFIEDWRQREHDADSDFSEL